VVGGITGGGEPWWTLGGHAHVDLTSGSVDFEVNGLVLAGSNGIGAPPTNTQVQGTLVCAPGLTTQMVFNTSPAVTLSAQGNAEFDGSFGPLPTTCTATNVAFLITITSNDHWIANGAVRMP
jgi:hypothetical protein